MASDSLEFEFDPKKSASNSLKHEISFDDAKSLWNDRNMIRFDLDYGGEKRWGIIAQYAGAKWTAICTTRGANIRIISVRRSTGKEVALYGKENNGR